MKNKKTWLVVLVVALFLAYNLTTALLTNNGFIAGTVMFIIEGAAILTGAGIGIYNAVKKK